MDFAIVGLSVLSIIVMCLPATILTKTKLLEPHSAIKAVSNILLYFVGPVAIFMSFQKADFSPAIATNLLHATLFAIGSFGITSLLSILILRPKNKSDDVKIYAFASVFPNCTFIGIPILMSIFPSQPEPIIYCAIFAAIFNMYVWTVGVYMLSGDKKYMSLKKAILNPTALTLILTIPLFVLDIKLIDFVPQLFSALDHIGNATAFFSMTVLGIRLATMNFLSIFKHIKNYISVIAKLIVCPFVIFCLTLLFPTVDIMVRITTVIVIAMPVATMAIVFAEKFCEKPETATALFALSTLCSIITLPIILSLF